MRRTRGSGGKFIAYQRNAFLPISRPGAGLPGSTSIDGAVCRPDLSGFKPERGVAHAPLAAASCSSDRPAALRISSLA